MRISQTPFNDLFILEPHVIGDERGYFMEAFNQKKLTEAGINILFVQDNQSSSRRGVLRGLHYQNAPYAQTKLVRVLSGAILDVAVDLRRGQSTYGKFFALELSAANKKQILVPKGFAHGFIVLSDYAEVLYKCDEYYHPKSEGGIKYDDPDIGIDWQLSSNEFILSDRDKNHPPLANANFMF